MNQKQVNQILRANRWGILSSPTVWVCIAALCVLALLTGCGKTEAQIRTANNQAKAIAVCDEVIARLAGTAVSRILPDGEQEWRRDGTPTKILYADEYACNVEPPVKVKSAEKGNTFICMGGTPNPSSWCVRPTAEDYSGFAPECYPLLLADDAGFETCWAAAQEAEVARRAEAKAEREAEAERQAAERKRQAEERERLRNSWEAAHCKIDAMDDVTRCWASSKSAAPDRPLDFPYGDTRLGVSFGCSSTGDEWAYFYFDGSPNFTGGDIKDGYHNRVFRIRWDGQKVKRHEATHDWGERFVHFKYGKGAINLFRAHNKALVRTPEFHGNGTRDFVIHMTGATAQIDEARRRCRG